MWTRAYWALVILVCVLAAGCALNLDQLVPQAAVSNIGALPVNIGVCSPGKTTPMALANKQAAQLTRIQSNINYVHKAIPELAAHPVVNAALQHVQFISANAIVSARRILGVADQSDDNYLASIAKPAPLAPSDVAQFSHTVADTVLRNTGGTPGGGGDEAQQFWAEVKAYYTQYYQGNFVNYFSQAVSKPTVQLTIGDAEITAAAGVFLELLFDELLTPTVWTDGSVYYPGGGKTQPTYLGVFHQKAATLAKPDGACGMTEAKVNTILYLANTFATAASGEVSVSVKSFGGLEVGLGIFGKLSVGDNSTLMSLVQAVVAESVKRLTVAIAAPILEAIVVSPANQSVQGGPALVAASRATNRAQTIQMYSAPFVSSTKTSL